MPLEDVEMCFFFVCLFFSLDLIAALSRTRGSTEIMQHGRVTTERLGRRGVAAAGGGLEVDVLVFRCRISFLLGTRTNRRSCRVVLGGTGGEILRLRS
jgi:hypothetical protein